VEVHLRKDAIVTEMNRVEMGERTVAKLLLKLNEKKAVPIALLGIDEDGSVLASILDPKRTLEHLEQVVDDAKHGLAETVWGNIPIWE
jgi:hypothetical protein